MTDPLAMLIKRVAELCQASLKACHYVKEFYLRRIRPLSHKKTLAFECPWMDNPSCDPSEGDLFILSPHC
jgi:hypothetical protein